MATKKVLKKKAVTIEEVEAPKDTTPEIVEKKSEPIKEWTYDELVLLSKEEFQKVEAQVRAGKAKFKSQQTKLHNGEN